MPSVSTSPRSAPPSTCNDWCQTPIVTWLRSEPRSVEAVDGGERFDRISLQPGRLVDRMTEEDRGDERMVVGESERRSSCRLDPAEEGGHDAAEAVGASRQHQVPAERVDRRAPCDG